MTGGERKDIFADIRVKHGSYLHSMWYVMYKTSKQKQRVPYEGFVLHSASSPVSKREGNEKPPTPTLIPPS
jgi:hypothetical protein